MDKRGLSSIKLSLTVIKTFIYIKMKKIIKLFVVMAAFSSCTGIMITRNVNPSGSVIIGPNQQTRRKVVIKNKSKNQITASTFKNGKESSKIILPAKRKRSIYLENDSKIEVNNNQQVPAKIKITVPGLPVVNISSGKAGK